MNKRFTEKYKRSKSHLANQLLLRVINQQYRGKNFTIFMVQNWMYGRTPNEILEGEFEKLMIELDPDGIKEAFEEPLTELSEI